MSSVKISFTRHRYLVLYLAAMNLLAFSNLFLTGQKLSSLWLLPMAVGSVLLTVDYLYRLSTSDRHIVNPIDLCVLAYLVVSLSSIVLYFHPSNPASPLAYVYGVHVQVFPMLMYFSVKSYEPSDVQRLLKTIIGLNVVFAVVGIALFVTRPDFYTDYLAEALGRTQTWEIYSRLQSYWGSTAAGILSAVTIVLLANVTLPKLLRYSLLMLFLVTIFLAQQRGAYISGVLATGYFFYREGISLPHVLAAMAVLSAGAFYALSYFEMDFGFLANIVDNRIVSDLILGDPFGERSVSYQKGLAFLMEFPLGLGLGATTSAADDAGAHVGGQVVDAYYMRVGADLGILGLVLFVIVLLVAVLSSFGRSHVRGIGIVVLIYALQSAGTNVLDSYYVSHLFWVLLGFLGRDRIAPRGASSADAKVTQ